jgi:hypothetical protein
VYTAQHETQPAECVMGAVESGALFHTEICDAPPQAWVSLPGHPVEQDESGNLDDAGEVELPQ